MELINPDYKSLLDNELKLDVCTLAPKFEEKDAKIYVNKKLTRMVKKKNWITNMASGVLTYTDKNDKERSIPIVAKFFFFMSPNKIDGITLMYEHKIYAFIRRNILATNVAPNFIGYIGDGKCSEESINKFIDPSPSEFQGANFDDPDEPFKNQGHDMFVLLTQFTGQRSLFQFIEDNIDGNYDVICSVIFQCFYICLVLEHFKIQHNDSHSGNVRVETLDKPVALCYTINGQRYVINTKHIVYIYDWDFAYRETMAYNPKVMNWCQSRFITNHMIHKRDLVYLLKNITYGRRTIVPFLKEIDDYLAQTYTDSLLLTLQSFSHFNKYTEAIPESSQVFCFGEGVQFEHVANRMPEYVIGCTNMAMDRGVDTHEHFGNYYNTLLSNVKHIRFVECDDLEFEYPHNFAKAETFTFIRYSMFLTSLEKMFFTLRYASNIQEITLVLNNTPINNLFELVHKYTRGLKRLTVLSSIPHDNNEHDMAFINQLNLEHTAVLMNKQIEGVNRPLEYLRSLNINAIWTYNDGKGIFPEMFEKVVNSSEDVVTYVKTIYLFLELMVKINTKTVPSVDMANYTRLQIFTCCLGYIFGNDEIIDEYTHCYLDTIQYISRSGLNIANIVTPIDVIFYALAGIDDNYRFQNVFENACLTLCQGVLNNVLPSKKTTRELAFMAIRNTRNGARYVKDEQYISDVFKLTNKKLIRYAPILIG